MMSFLVSNHHAAGNAQNPVILGTAGDYAVHAKSGISTVAPSVITGDIGVSPITGTAITGFSLTLKSNRKSSLSTQVVGTAYAASYVAPTPYKLTVAIDNMETAYTDAAGRPNDEISAHQQFTWSHYELHSRSNIKANSFHQRKHSSISILMS